MFSTLSHEMHCFIPVHCSLLCLTYVAALCVVKRLLVRLRHQTGKWARLLTHSDLPDAYLLDHPRAC